MRINQNISAMNTHASMVRADSSISKSLERLSSGLRINRAADDAAGLAISEKMRGQIRGLQQANRNAQDGISLLQTAEGALNETHSILQRMRELAVQSANDTLTDTDRGEIQKEVDQLTKEVDRISKSTEFNTKSLLRGTVNLSGSTQDVKTAALASAGAISIANGTTHDLDFSGVSGNFVEGQSVTLGANTYVAGTDFNVGANLQNSLTNLATAITGDAAGLGISSAALQGSNAIRLTNNTGSGASISGFSYTGSTTGTINIAQQVSSGATVTVGTHTFTFGDGTGGTVAIGADANATATNLATSVAAISGLEASASNGTITVNSTEANKTLATDAGLSLTMHIGANAGQSMSVSLSNMDAGSLGIGRDANGNAITGGADAAQGINVSTQSSANSAITAIDTALSTVSSERSKLGAYQNRLEHTISNLGAASENLSASESRIRDVDMAEEMANFSKSQILMQASTAMMAQANQKPQAVLKLLG